MNLYEKIKIWDEFSEAHVVHTNSELVGRFKDKKNLVIIDVGANSGTLCDKLLENLDVKLAI